MASIPRTRQAKNIRYDKIITLIGEGEPYQNEFGGWITPEVKRRVKAQRLELSNKDYTNAVASGLRWEIQFETYAKQYKGETLLEHNGDLFTIVRSRNVDNDKGIRLVCESRAGNAPAPDPAPDPGGGVFSD